MADSVVVTHSLQELKAVEPATALPALPPSDNTTFDEDDNSDIPPY